MRKYRFAYLCRVLLLAAAATLPLLLMGCGGAGSSSAASAQHEWVWMGGSNKGMQGAVYGTMGTPAALNTPGARFASASWTDAQGNFWIYGGDGLVSYGISGYLNDLWKYSNGQWTWVNGPSTKTFPLAPGNYGTLGVAAATNIPSPRANASGWIDKNGNLWLFGGVSPNAEPFAWYNDLWEYTP